MKQVYNTVIFDFHNQKVNFYKFNKIINNLFDKNNINIILYNYHIDSILKEDCNVYYIKEKKQLDNIVGLLNGFYFKQLNIIVDCDDFDNFLFYKNNKKIDIEQLLNYNFVSSIQSLVIDKNEYINKMAALIEQQEKLKRVLFNKYNKKIKRNFHNNYTINDIFDEMTGGIYFKDCEWALLDDTELKNVFATKEENSFVYLLESDNSKILRGCDTYYYLLAYKGKYNNVSLDNINTWNNNNIIFLNKCKKSLDNFKIKNYLDRKLVLGLLDNIRGYNLQMLNLYSLFLYNNSTDITFCVDVTSNSNFDKFNKLIDETNNLMIDVLFKNVKITSLIKLLDEIMLEYTNKIDEINNSSGDNFYNKGLKSHREADNFIENYIAAKEYGKHLARNKKVNLITLLYGGIEIPMLLKMKKKSNIVIYIMSVEGVYKDRHLRSNDKKNQQFECYFNNKIKGYNVLCDDNVLTGKTIEQTLKILIDNNVIVNEIFVIKHPDMNRIEHLWDSKSYINLNLFHKFIHGGIFSGNYSRVKTNTNYGGTYLDKLGRFDISKDFICKCIYTNERYSKESRINEYNIFLK